MFHIEPLLRVGACDACPSGAETAPTAAHGAVTRYINRINSQGRRALLRGRRARIFYVATLIIFALTKCTAAAGQKLRGRGGDARQF